MKVGFEIDKLVLTKTGKKKQKEFTVVISRVEFNRKYKQKEFLNRLYKIKQEQVNQVLVTVNDLQSEMAKTENRFFGLKDSIVTSLGI